MKIISLIFTIMSVIYSILRYYSIDRYMYMYLFPIETYAKNYKKLDKLGTNRTIISLILDRDRLNKITPVIKSLLDQTVKVDLICCNVPYDVPKHLSKYISIFKCGGHKGELDCIIPTIMREKESTTRIITLGTSKIYGKDYIETLLEEYEKNPNTIIYENNKNDLIDITSGVVFSTDFFDENFVHPPENTPANEWLNNYFKDFPKKRVTYKENYKLL